MCSTKCIVKLFHKKNKYVRNQPYVTSILFVSDTVIYYFLRYPAIRQTMGAQKLTEDSEVVFLLRKKYGPARHPWRIAPNLMAVRFSVHGSLTGQFLNKA